MQITIPQSEIEAAIIDYIQSRVQISENMHIDIELRATRGAEGFQAVIDIYPEGQPCPKAAATGTKEKAKALPAAKTKASAAPKKVVSKVLTPPAEPETQVEETPVEAPVEAVVEETTTPVHEPEVVATQIAQSVEAEAPSAEPKEAKEAEAPKAASIFANAQAKQEEAAAAEPTTPAKSIFGSLRRPINSES